MSASWLSASRPAAAKPPPTIRSGGIAKKGTARFDNMEAKYKGLCCDGTRKWGDGNPYKRSDGILVYCCGACRQELPRPTSSLTDEQRARIEEKRQAALARRKRAREVRGTIQTQSATLRSAPPCV